MMAALFWNMVPAPWRLGLSIGVILAIVALAGGAYLYVRHQGYEDGFGQAQAECEAEKQAQAEANDKAIRDAEKRLMEAADKLSIKGLQLDEQLDTIDAAVAADPDGGALCLSADSVRRLNAIK